MKFDGSVSIKLPGTISFLLGAGVACALPEGWTITPYATPPDAEYPTAISAAANGDW
jgi:hypothetical protein